MKANNKKQKSPTLAVPRSVQQASLTNNSRLHRSCAVSARVPLLTTMTNPRPKFQTFKLFKLILISLAAVTVALFTAASLRTLSLDVNVGLQLAAWEKARNISLVVDARRRDELLANFKGNLQHVSARDQRRPKLSVRVRASVQRPSGSPRCPSRRRSSTPPRWSSSTGCSEKVTFRALT